jgi:glycosyltransferase involved in cell wall biosynthesis
MQNEKVKASFVIPVYDGDAYLAETLDSILRSSLKEIEVIVIDDCSPDFTDELVKFYMMKDPRILYHRFEVNQGVEAARNFGNNLASAPIILVSDQDDLSAKHRASYSVAFLNKHPEVNCLTSAYAECNVDGQIKETFRPKTMTRELFEKGDHPWFHSSAAYRKMDILALPYRHVDGQTDDYTLLDDWTKAGMKFHSANKVLGGCRRVPWGVMAQRRQAQGLGANYYL